MTGTSHRSTLVLIQGISCCLLSELLGLVACGSAVCNGILVISQCGNIKQPLAIKKYTLLLNSPIFLLFCKDAQGEEKGGHGCFLWFSTTLGFIS